MSKKISSARKPEILTAAKKVIAEKGYYRTSVDDIARSAGVAKGTVYLYFRTKEELFVALIEHMFDEMIGLINQADKTVGTVKDKLRKLLVLELTFIEKNKEFINLFGQEMQDVAQQFKKNLKKRLVAKYFQSLNSVGKIIQSGIKEGGIRNISSLTAGLVFSGIVHCYVYQWVNGLTKRPLLSYVDEMLEIFFSGVEYRKNKLIDSEG